MRQLSICLVLLSSIPALAVRPMARDEAFQLTRKCLKGTAYDVKAYEILTSERRTENGESYWLIKIDLEKPAPESGRFMSIFDSGKIEYLAFHKSIKFKIETGQCKIADD